MKKTIRFNERQLRQIVAESVRRVLNEVDDTEEFEYDSNIYSAPQTEFDVSSEYDPEFENYMSEKYPFRDEAKKLGEKMKPYLNRFSEMFNDYNYNCLGGIRKNAQRIIRDASNLPSLASYITTYENH